MTYSGLCIDGPMDGQRVVAASTRLQAEELVSDIETVKSYETFDGPKDIAFGTRTSWYVWHEPGLWLLEGIGPEAARIHMAEAIGTEVLASRYEQLRARQRDDESRGG